MTTLKNYEVDESGNVRRLKFECPNCGAGFFMAKHADRLVCGKCHLTYGHEEKKEE